MKVVFCLKRAGAASAVGKLPLAFVFPMVIQSGACEPSVLCIAIVQTASALPFGVTATVTCTCQTLIQSGQIKCHSPLHCVYALGLFLPQFCAPVCHAVCVTGKSGSRVTKLASG